MPNSSATKTSRLLNPGALLLVAIAVGVLLWATFRNEDAFSPREGQVDEVAAGYGEVLLAAHPDDSALRIKLLHLLIQLSEYDRAQRHLDEWPKPDPAIKAYYQLELDALRLNQSTDAPALAALRERFEAFDYKKLPNEQLERLAALELTAQAPALSADAYAELAQRDPAQRDKWLNEAAKWYMASEQPSRAADVFLQLLASEPLTEERLPYLEHAIKGLVAADRGNEAVDLLNKEMTARPDGQYDSLLDLAVDVAIAHDRLPEAKSFFAQWLAKQPETPEVLAIEFKRRLAFDDQEGAKVAGEKLLVLHPDDQVLLLQMAHLSEWQRDTHSALTYWIRLTELRNNPIEFEHTWRLALQTFDFDRGIPLLANIRNSRALTDIELDALVYAHESLGTPKQAEEWLRSYTHQYPKHRLAWVRLLQNLENTDQHEPRLVVWTDFAKHFPVTVPERIDWSNNYVHLFDYAGAWRVITGVDSSTINDFNYWQVRAALAWQMENDPELQLALEHMLQIKGSLFVGDEVELIGLYRQSNPQKALQLMTDSWNRDHEPAMLVLALQQAQDLNDWALINDLLTDAVQYPRAYAHPQVLAMRGAFAMQQGKPEEALRLYRQGIQEYPTENIFRERLLWVLVDLGRTNELKPLLVQWKALARSDSAMWLPFAAASQMLGRNTEALAWYRLYLASNSQDWLVKAGYADALESAGFADKAQRLRLQLNREVTPEMIRTTPQGYATWLRLLGSSFSSRRAMNQAMQWQDGSKPMLQVWFDQFIARLDENNQASQKEEWLAWARSRGLKVGQYDEIQEALRTHNRATLERLVASGGLDPAQQSEAMNTLGHNAAALGLSLSAMGDEPSPVIQNQLLRQAVELTESKPQGAQISWEDQDYGGLSFNSPRLTVARNLGEDWYAKAVYEQGRYSGDAVDSGRMGTERNLELTLQRDVYDGNYKMLLDTSQRKDADRDGFGASRTWTLSSGVELDLGADWHIKSEDTGMMRAFGQQDDLWLGGRHRLTARDQLSWRIAQRYFSTRQDESLGNGQDMRLEYTHILQFEGPTWELRGGLDYQHNNLSSRTYPSLANRLTTIDENDDEQFTNGKGAIDVAGLELGDQNDINASTFLQKRYGQLSFGSSWRRGFPGALNRTRGQYTWLVDLNSGWQWTNNTLNYGVTTGLGMEVIGDDELAFTFGYQSKPQGSTGQSGGTVGVSYGVRFGR